jgi:hypothetical protein
MKQKFDYVINDGTITITGLFGPSGDVIIPSTIDGLPVIGIGAQAFSGCTRLTSVTIPDSVTNIGDEAFRNCASLTSITIPDSVTSIGSDAFVRCIGLTNVTIGDSVTTIGESAFYSCTSLISVTIPDSVTTIGESGFDHCASLTNVTIGNSVTTIGDSAFFDCTSLTNVTIPSSVTTIGWNAFYGCTSLTDVKFEEGFVPKYFRIPEGDITVYKKLRNDVICTLKIPKEAKRVGGIIGNKCRAEYATVMEGDGLSFHDESFQYRIGEIVRPDKFDQNPLTECSSGIHFFLTKEEAEKYNL